MIMSGLLNQKSSEIGPFFCMLSRSLCNLCHTIFDQVAGLLFSSNQLFFGGSYAPKLTNLRKNWCISVVARVATRAILQYVPQLFSNTKALVPTTITRLQRIPARNVGDCHYFCLKYIISFVIVLEPSMPLLQFPPTPAPSAPSFPTTRTIA